MSLDILSMATSSVKSPAILSILIIEFSAIRCQRQRLDYWVDNPLKNAIMCAA